jgi:hypothetical protein
MVGLGCVLISEHRIKNILPKTDTKKTVFTVRSNASVRYSEQNNAIRPLELVGGTGSNEQPGQAPRTDGFFRASIIKNALLRDQVQSALSDLIHKYEETTGLSVIRVVYQAETRGFSIEAIPAR